MVATPCCRLMAALVAAFIFSSGGSLLAQGFPRGHRDPWGSRYETIPGGGHVLRREYIGLDAVRRWNEVVLNANALDHVPWCPRDRSNSALFERPGLLQSSTSRSSMR